MTGRKLAKQEGKDWNSLSSKGKHKLDAQAHIKVLVKKHRLDINSKDGETTIHHPRMQGNGPTRNTLMMRAKDKGIKNFRVMNKEELERVLVPGLIQVEVLKIAAGAVERWKAGQKK